MSEIKFACPQCGQKVSCDPGYAGNQINCPACQQTLTVPVPGPAAPVTRITSPVNRTAPAETERPVSERSRLAAASLICSLFLSVGCIPGIVCGHLALRQIRRNIFLTGAKLAATGLALSYFFLLSTMAVLAYGAYALEPIAGQQISTKDGAGKSAAELAAQRTDEVINGDTASEAAHGVRSRGYSYNGEANHKKFRDAHPGAAFGYYMKVDPTRPMTFRCTYWGSDSDLGRLFDILINDKVIATQKLDYNDPGHFFDVEYKIPEELTKGQDQVSVEFRPRPGMFAGGVFGCQMLKR